MQHLSLLLDVVVHAIFNSLEINWYPRIFLYGSNFIYARSSISKCNLEDRMYYILRRNIIVVVNIYKNVSREVSTFLIRDRTWQFSREGMTQVCTFFAQKLGWMVTAGLVCFKNSMKKVGGGLKLHKPALDLQLLNILSVSLHHYRSARPPSLLMRPINGQEKNIIDMNSMVVEFDCQIKLALFIESVDIRFLLFLSITKIIYRKAHHGIMGRLWHYGGRRAISRSFPAITAATKMAFPHNDPSVQYYNLSINFHVLQDIKNKVNNGHVQRSGKGYAEI